METNDKPKREIKRTLQGISKDRGAPQGVFVYEVYVKILCRGTIERAKDVVTEVHTIREWVCLGDNSIIIHTDWQENWVILNTFLYVDSGQNIKGIKEEGQ